MQVFGHAVGISLLGWLIRLQQSADTTNRLGALRRQPRRAAWIAFLSLSYGIVYFGGKHLPDAYFFWQRTVMSILEVIVIFSFLGFLVAFGPFLGFWTTARSGHQVAVARD